MQFACTEGNEVIRLYYLLVIGNAVLAAKMILEKELGTRTIDSIAVLVDLSNSF